MTDPPMSHPQRSIPAAVTLFFVAPLVAEFLLGDFPATWLPLILVLAPMYGGGALFIRELTRRTGRGWPTILLLGVAYAITEEAFTTQSLFNPHYLGMHAHLLAHAWIPSLGIGAWWTIFMLNVHAFWSVGVSIALAEGLFPSPGGLFPSRDGLYPPTKGILPSPGGLYPSPSGLFSSRARALWLGPAPWLGKIGLSVVTFLFAAGIYANTYYSLHHDPFRASLRQLLVSALFVVAFAIAAFLIAASVPNSVSAPGLGSAASLPVPPAWLTGIAAFLLGAAVFLAPIFWNWGAVVWMLAVDLAFLLLLWVFSRREGWTSLHTLSIGAGGALVYAVHAFISKPVVPCPRWVVLPSHVLFLVLALAVVALGAHRTRSALLLDTQNRTPAQP